MAPDLRLEPERTFIPEENMKFILLIMMSFCTTLAFAKTKTTTTRTMVSQKSPSQDWVLSPVVGFTAMRYDISGMPASEITNVSSQFRSGYTIGADLTLPFYSRYFTYNAGLTYSESTTAYSYNVNNDFFVGIAENENTLRRLNLPLSVSYFPFLKRNFVFVKAGIVSHYLISGTAKSSSDGQLKENGQLRNYSTSEEYAVERKHYKNFGFDALISTGLKFSGKNGLGFLVEAQYQHGLTNIVSFDSPEKFTTQSVIGLLGLNLSF